MVRLYIDDILTEVDEGTTVIEAARSVGIDIPSLCNYKELSRVGACRLCVVEIEGGVRNGLLPACIIRCADNMKVKTKTNKVIQARTAILKLIKSNHPEKCICVKNGDCELQKLFIEYGIKHDEYAGGKIHHEIDDSNEFFIHEPDKCILCTRCVRICEQVQCRNILAEKGRGLQSVIEPAFDKMWGNVECEKCGNCVSACPTGALVFKRRLAYKKREITTVDTVCGECNAGCHIKLAIKDNKIVDIYGDDGKVNNGYLCAKGRNQTFEYLYDCNRITKPMIRNKETNILETTSYEKACDYVVQNLKKIEEIYGSESISVIEGTCLTNEEIQAIHSIKYCDDSKEDTYDSCLLDYYGRIQKLSKDIIITVGITPKDVNMMAEINIRRSVNNGARLIDFDNVSKKELIDIVKNLSEQSRISYMCSADKDKIAIVKKMIDDTGRKDRSEIFIISDRYNMNGSTFTSNINEHSKAVVIFGEDITSEHITCEAEFLTVFSSDAAQIDDKVNVIFPKRYFVEKNGTIIDIEGNIQQCREYTFNEEILSITEIVNKINENLV